MRDLENAAKDHKGWKVVESRDRSQRDGTRQIEEVLCLLLLIKREISIYVHHTGNTFRLHRMYCFRSVV